MVTAKDIINQAKKFIGFSENNGKYLEIINVYNSQSKLPRGYRVKPTDEWCATFVSAVSILCKATNIMPTECSCEQMINLYKSLGRFIENENITPCPADIIFYDWNDKNQETDCTGWADHTGIVEKVENGKIFVIEGNYNRTVQTREIKINAKYIRGFARPNYDVEVSKPSETIKSNSEVAKEVLKGLWGSGNERKTRLTQAGYNYTEIQKIVNQMLSTGSETFKSNSEVAKEVIRGLWGSGDERKSKLEKAGYNYKEIQKIVNELLK